MKKLFILSIMIFSTLTTTVFAIDNPWLTKLPFKEGLIVYKVAGSMNGKKALYIKDYGQSKAEYYKVTVDMMGMSNTESSTTITTPDWVYTIDNTTKQGIKEVNPKKYLIKEFEKLSDSDKEIVAKNAEMAGKISSDGLQGEMKKDAATINGYKCDMVSLMGTKIYMFAGTDIPVKTEGNTMGIKISEVATSIKKGTPPAKAFKLPNIQFHTDNESDQMMKNQAKVTIQGLLEGRSMQDMQFDDENDIVFQDADEFPFDDEMSDDDAIQFRTNQQSTDEDEYNEEDAAKDIQKGLGKIFKNMF